MKCNMEHYEGNGVYVKCGKEARWIHPRWPTGLYCDECKELLERFFKGDWQEIDCEKQTDI